MIGTNNCWCPQLVGRFDWQPQLVGYFDWKLQLVGRFDLPMVTQKYSKSNRANEKWCKYQIMKFSYELKISNKWHPKSQRTQAGGFLLNMPAKSTEKSCLS